MKEIIIVAGESKVDVCWVRHCLNERGYNSLPCRSAAQIVEELEILPTCDAHVPLVVVDPRILDDIDHDLLEKLSDRCLDVPILPLGAVDSWDDPVEIFEKICENRAGFKREQNPDLAAVLESAGVVIV